ncbi:MAG: hypothetical protein HYR56_01495 [Acidobacteria bacterium]|nr:hypothetical protein [Acidobacteriota bacterium]MBI3427096.1 hypothetical protein [Acidobacteriota bacterium]
MNATLNERIAPEIVNAIIGQATSRGLSVNDYLRQALGLNAQPQELAVAPQPPQPRNEAMFAVLQRSAERMKDVPVTGSTEETLKLIREARAGAMWGYEPTDTGD